MTHSRLHLKAAGIAASIAGVAVAVVISLCLKLEKSHVHTLAPELSDLKLQGVALQRAAFAEKDLLVLYGSSELVGEVPNRAADFFEQYPTGFRVFPVGKAGTVSLAILQKLAAVGPAIQGRKVALSLSPSFFFSDTVNADYYEGNFSALQAQELAFSGDLTRSLKRAAAQRMLQYPETLEGQWTLEFALDRLASDTGLDRALYHAVLPLGKLSVAVGRMQDHIEAGLQILTEDTAPDTKPAKVAGVNWRDVLRRASEQSGKTMRKMPKLAQRPKGSRDASFLASLGAADEWDDFELILRTLRELGAEPLLMSMPLHGPDLELTGVSAPARKAYGERLTALATRYSVPLAYFQQFEEDPTFFADHLDHPGAKGWALFNVALDSFYHAQPSL